MQLLGHSLFLLYRLLHGWNFGIRAVIMGHRWSWEWGSQKDCYQVVSAISSMKASENDVSRQSTTLRPFSYRKPPCSRLQPFWGSPHPMTDHWGSIKPRCFSLTQDNSEGLAMAITAWLFSLLIPALSWTYQTGLCVACSFRLKCSSPT